MYNNNVLPQTGAVSLGILGLSTQNSVVIGLCLIITGLVIYRAVRFKIKDSKNN